MNDKSTLESNENAKSPPMTLTVRQLADRMQVSMPTAYAIVNQEDFPKFYAGKKILIPITQFERWLEHQACDEATRQKARKQWKRCKTKRN